MSRGSNGKEGGEIKDGEAGAEEREKERRRRLRSFQNFRRCFNYRGLIYCGREEEFGCDRPAEGKCYEMC